MRRQPTFFSLLILITLSMVAFGQSAGAQSDDDEIAPKDLIGPEGAGPWVVKIHFDDKATVQSYLLTTQEERILSDSG